MVTRLGRNSRSQHLPEPSMMRRRDLVCPVMECVCAVTFDGLFGYLKPTYPGFSASEGKTGGDATQVGPWTDTSCSPLAELPAYRASVNQPSTPSNLATTTMGPSVRGTGGVCFLQAIQQPWPRSSWSGEAEAGSSCAFSPLPVTFFKDEKIAQLSFTSSLSRLEALSPPIDSPVLVLSLSSRRN